MVGCTCCGEIGAFAEVANPQDVDGREVFEDLPAAVGRLVVPNRWLERYFQYSQERLLQCPACGSYFSYRRWAPGGSDDVLHSTIHESVQQLTAEEALALLEREVNEARQRAQREPALYRRQAEWAVRGLRVEQRRTAQRTTQRRAG